MDIKGKVVVITGGAGGIGQCMVKELLKNEVKFVAIFELDRPNTKNVLDELKGVYGGVVGFYPCDVTKTEQLTYNLDKVISQYGTIDILINNAGIPNENEYELMMDLNYKAVVVGSIKLIERIGKHRGGKGGTIINTASILGLTNSVMPVYCSTKHAVVSFTRTMEDHFDVTGVRVIAICPGLTTTSLVDGLIHGLDFINTAEVLDHLTSQPPEKVGEALIEVIKHGRCGEVWVIEKSLPPYRVKEEEDYKTMKINE